MIAPQPPAPSAAAVVAHNRAALAEILRAVSLRPDRFSLVLVRCNYSRLQRLAVDHLQGAGLVERSLPPQTTSLLQALTPPPDQPRPPALLVTGLDQVENLTAVLRAANLGRNAFPQALPVPLVLWMSDRTLARLTRHAPDFKSFAGAPILLDYPPGDLIASLHASANELFATMLALGDHSPLPSEAPAYRPGSALRTELEFALADIAQTSASLDSELQASLDFLKGRDAFSRGDLDLARYHFDQSLPHTQKSPHPPTPRQKQALLLFYLGATCRSQAVFQRSMYDRLLHKAEDYFSACLRIFRDLPQPDLVGKFIHALAEVQQKLGDWAALDRTAQEGLTLHRQDPVRLARDHGYLAEVALAQGTASEAQAQAERALEILTVAGALEGGTPAGPAALANQYQRGWYLYLLGRVHLAQGLPEAAIALLEEARQYTDPQVDLPLYRSLLQTLQKQYHHQGDYRAAFGVKLQQRQVETQFRLRAFIGAGEIQPRAFPPAGADSAQALMATEIQASGRQGDVAALTDRLEQARYPLVILHGPSGVGKSSILSAGLVPALGRSFPEGRSTLPVLVKGYRDWPDEVNQALAAALHSQGNGDGAPPAAPIDQATLTGHLRALTETHYRQIVLIFDQLEEFFVESHDIPARRDFYAFLVDCLNIPYLKLVLALREDYLHYLLELERGFNLDILNNDILSRDYRYYLGNFSTGDAGALIRRLTDDAHFYLEPALIERLVKDLATALGEVRPIELQVVGAQLQRQDITTLLDYLALGKSPKETLVQRFLNNVVQDCGDKNAALARLTLYLLTDVDRENRPYRPQKSREDLEEELVLRGFAYQADQLDLVLEILVGSGLVFLLPAVPIDRYQLVHDYLVAYARQTPPPQAPPGGIGRAPSKQR